MAGMSEAYPELWQKYGLSLMAGIHGRVFEAGVRSHWRVAHYLEAHPDVAAGYNADQTGKVKYFDVLFVAEREIGWCAWPQGG